MTYSFPKNFLWGTATAAHQVEGNNVNSDGWLLEHLPDSPFAEPSGDACDHYHRYPEHIALLAQLGLNAYRFSIEWARVEPEEGYFSRAELDHYRRMLATCREHGLTPFVTLHHFTSPRWLLASGGWESDATPAKFARFCERVTRDLGDLIGGACTLNEPNLGDLLSAMHFRPPMSQLHSAPWWLAAARSVRVKPEDFAPYLFVVSPQARKIMLGAHRAGYAAIKSVRDTFPVGLTLALQDVQAVEGGETNAQQLRYTANDSYLEALRGDDFVGVQSYSRVCVGTSGVVRPEPNAEVTQMGYEFYPEALEHTIREAVAISGCPVIVTENGIGTMDDTRRVAYIERALQGVTQCLADGLDVRGYFYWSAFDNYEWQQGYRPHFGLIGVDRESFAITIKPSARRLGDIAQANAF
ncbi:MAG: glycoside hydrolase family 1 protein [Thermoflexales bacterium]|nr:glycoside hydrolase family 1 protein [Thermoflexales bacterium]